MSTITIPASIRHGLIEMIFRDDSRQPELEPLCRKVLEKFQLPQRSLICIFDDVDYRQAYNGSPDLGNEYRGFLRPLREQGSSNVFWPRDIVRLLKNDRGILYDAMIYLRQRTCQSQVGVVITFTHELQHFMQYGFSYKVWRAVGSVKKVYAGEPLAPWCLPCENEAQLVSKQIACEVLGHEMVLSYAEQQIENGNDPEKWRFFKKMDLEESFDLLEQTKPWVNTYREALKVRFPADSSEEPDFTKDNWWE